MGSDNIDPHEFGERVKETAEALKKQNAESKGKEDDIKTEREKIKVLQWALKNMTLMSSNTLDHLSQNYLKYGRSVAEDKDIKAIKRLIRELEDFASILP